jgi:hypothetical protein
MDDLDNEYNPRRGDDRIALSMLYTLTERITSVIKQLDDFAEFQREIRVTLGEHERMVTRELNNWRWFMFVVTILGSTMAGLGTYSYKEFNSIRDSVLIHLAEDAGKTQRQDSINHDLQQQIINNKGR